MFEVDTEVVNLLGTDYVPNQLETESIGEIMARYETVMYGMDTKLEKLKNEIVRIQEAKEQVQHRFHKLSGLLAPIRRLPPEILGQTFVHTLLRDSYWHWMNGDICVDTISLLNICRICVTDEDHPTEYTLPNP
ncbi:hypothetical protein M422DRAFT_254382 [Sphaerobolus stellatus SS14]|uniref:Uncharacterized protein n=1 Tax=Sphaerobolus stellatus (strain SS14) TaxID=990650 RepID=A0A0C9V6I6_SPHS4|nr:hypothetical protein M422DRAFT_254382 [Sphaerobolus stellatus SS14]